MGQQDTCPTCGQVLPVGITANSLHEKLERERQLAIRQAAIAEKKRLEAEYAVREANIRRIAVADARRSVEGEVENKLKLAEREKIIAVNEAKKDATAEATATVTARFTAERSRWQTEIDDLKRKLEKKTAGELGEESEADLFAQLRDCYPDDRIEHGGRTGADIVHIVMDEHRKEAGRIVYEDKNSLMFTKAFIEQVREQRTQCVSGIRNLRLI